jgi:hypothetical protein
MIAFEKFSLSLLLKNLSILCHVVLFFIFLLLDYQWASCIYDFTDFIKFGTMLVYIILHVLFLYPCLLWDNYTYFMSYEVVLHWCSFHLWYIFLCASCRIAFISIPSNSLIVSSSKSNPAQSHHIPVFFISDMVVSI